MYSLVALHALSTTWPPVPPDIILVNLWTINQNGIAGVRYMRVRMLNI